MVDLIEKMLSKIKDTRGAAATTTLAFIAITSLFIAMIMLGESTTEHRYENKESVTKIVQDAEEIKSDHENIDINQLQEQMDSVIVQTAIAGGKIGAGIYDDFYVWSATEQVTGIFSDVEADANDNKDDIEENVQEQPNPGLKDSAKQAVKNKVTQKIELGTSEADIETTTSEIWLYLTEAASIDIEDISVKDLEEASQYCEEIMNTYLEEQQLKAEDEIEEIKKEYHRLKLQISFLEQKLKKYENACEEAGALEPGSGYYVFLERLEDLNADLEVIDDEMDKVEGWKEFAELLNEGINGQEISTEDILLTEDATEEETDVEHTVMEEPQGSIITLKGTWTANWSCDITMSINLNTGKVTGSGSGSGTGECKVEEIDKETGEIVGVDYVPALMRSDISINGSIDPSTKEISGTFQITTLVIGSGSCAGQSIDESSGFTGKLFENNGYASGTCGGKSWSVSR